MIQITTREAKGSPLSNQEQDANLIALRDAIDALVGQVTGVFVTGFTQDPETQALSLSFSDGTVIGPIVLPLRTVRARGDWSSGTLYEAGDIMRQDDNSYIAGVGHVSDVFADDLGLGRIELLVRRGIDGRNGDVEEAPLDGQLYVRQSDNWTVAPLQTRRRGAWSSNLAIGGTTRYKRRDSVEHRGRIWDALADDSETEPGSVGSEDHWRCLTPLVASAAASAWKTRLFADALSVPTIADPAVLAPLPGVLQEIADLAGGSGGGIEDAPSDGKAYNRKSGAWAEASAGGMFRDRGVWSNATATGPAAAHYKRLDVVDFQGRFWVVSESDVQTPPSIYGAAWRCLTLATAEASQIPPAGQLESIGHLYGRDLGDLQMKQLSTLIGDLRARIKTLEDAA